VVLELTNMRSYPLIARNSPAVAVKIAVKRGASGASPVKRPQLPSKCGSGHTLRQSSVTVRRLPLDIMDWQ